jgi:hypothetical protein
MCGHYYGDFHREPGDCFDLNIDFVYTAMDVSVSVTTGFARKWEGITLKILINIALATLLPVTAFAQVSGMNEDQMQKMMQNMQKMQACIAQVDQAALRKMASDGEAMQGKVQSLCTSGKRAEAEQVAMKFAQDYVDNKEMKKLKECGEHMAGIMPDLPSIVKDIEEKGTHVCDTF